MKTYIVAILLLLICVFNGMEALAGDFKIIRNDNEYRIENLDDKTSKAVIEVLSDRLMEKGLTAKDIVGIINHAVAKSQDMSYDSMKSSSDSWVPVIKDPPPIDICEKRPNTPSCKKKKKDKDETEDIMDSVEMESL